MMQASGGEVVLPPYYLVHETPEGPRFAYPRPGGASLGTPFSVPGSTPVEWSAVGGLVVQHGEWLVSTAPLGEVTASWYPGDKPGPWVKREEPPVEPLALQAWQQAPTVPTDDASEHYRTYGCELDELCLRCQLHRVIYLRTVVTSPVESRRFDFSLWRPLPGDVDEYPDRQWVVDEPSLLAVYGPHTAHLWAGQMPGFRDAVQKALEADSRTEHVFTDRGARRPVGQFEVVVRIPWEKPRTRMRDRYGRGGRKLRGREQVPDPIAHMHRATRFVPEGLSGATKAEAGGSWRWRVAGVVGSFIPADVVACDRCDGHGHLLAGPEESP